MLLFFTEERHVMKEMVTHHSMWMWTCLMDRSWTHGLTLCRHSSLDYRYDFCFSHSISPLSLYNLMIKYYIIIITILVSFRTAKHLKIFQCTLAAFPLSGQSASACQGQLRFHCHFRGLIVPRRCFLGANGPGFLAQSANLGPKRANWG